MKSNTFLQRIRKLGKLTPSEARLVDFFESNYPLTAFETITSMSQKAGVGTATVGRFLNRLGYKGFSKFMDEMRRDVVNRLESPIERYSERKDQTSGEQTDYLAQHINYTLKNLEETYARVKPADFNEAARLMATCEGSLYIMGASTSQSLAQFFFLLAKYLRCRVYLLDANLSTIRHNLVDVSSRDVLLAIHHFRFSSQTAEVARWFARKTCPIILLSDKEVTPISDLARIHLYASSEGPPLFNSRMASLLILESLLVAMAPYLESEMYERFETFEVLREQFGTYAHWPRGLSADRTGRNVKGRTGQGKSASEARSQKASRPGGVNKGR